MHREEDVDYTAKLYNISISKTMEILKLMDDLIEKYKVFTRKKGLWFWL